MCGIFGYIGKNKSIEILLDSLKSLEYRGYDSGGIAYLKDNKIEIIKSIGKINNLEEKVNKNIDTSLGIGHTRWATHGGVNIHNCHPHRHGKITLVHNGIIENYLEIKNKLISLDYTFYGDTDSEVLCALIDYYYNQDNDILNVLNKVTKEVIGSYATCIIIDNNYDYIYVIRKDSPLIIGISNNKKFISSDIPAIIKYTNKYILLDDYDIACISKNNVSVYNNKKLLTKDIHIYDNNQEVYGKDNFEHYMLKEIYEQPNLIIKNLPDNLKNIPNIKKYNNIYIVACGSAYHAGLLGKHFIEEYVNIPVHVDIASEFRYNKLFLNSNDLVIIISQSGETADTLAALRRAKNMSIDTLAIVNVESSSIAREADNVIYTNAGIEVAVATTKAYMMQVFILGLIAIKNSSLKYNEIINEYKLLPNQINNILNNNKIKEIAKMLYQENDIFFLGRGIDYYVSLEGNLKLKEIAYIHSEAYPSGELKHGTISLIEKNTKVISIITDKKIKDKTLSNIKEVISRGAKSIIICTNDIDIDKSYYDEIIKVPESIDILKPILTIVPLQLIAYEVAKLKECDIDKPKNLAKSVTVE